MEHGRNRPKSVTAAAWWAAPCILLRLLFYFIKMICTDNSAPDVAISRTFFTPITRRETEKISSEGTKPVRMRNL